LPHGRFVYRAISKVGDYLGMIPKNDADHKKLIGKAMFLAANLQIFGPLVGTLVVLLLIVYFVRRRKSAG
jgi:ascorbate-specific PTS system EIIC-type component UlaA